MLPNLSKKLSFNNIDIQLSRNVIGKKITIKNNSDYVFEDLDLQRLTTIENLNYKTLFDKSSKLLKVINFDKNEDIVDLVPEKYVIETKRDLSNLFKRDISDYYFEVLSKRYQLTNRINDSVYDHSETVTGRMKITSGVNYLTMKKDMRSLIDIKPGNTLVEIDIKSCEPALLHAILYNSSPKDLYGHFGKNNPRSKVKLAVISSIYGSSVQKVRKMTGLPKEDILAIRNHFKLDDIKNYILKEYEKNGYFCNLYGRPINSVNSPINYWLQSSAADYACLAFLNLIDRANFNLRAVIHDAVLLELNQEEIKIAKNLKKIKDPISNICLNVEYSVIK